MSKQAKTQKIIDSIQPNCKNCENENLLKVADLEFDLQRAKNTIELLEKCLDTKEDLNRIYREQIRELENKLRIYE